MLDHNSLHPDVLAIITVPDDAIERQYPDVDKETQHLKVPHQCEVTGQTEVLEFSFGSWRAGTQKQACPHCSAEVTVEKYNGGQFVAYNQDMVEELLLEA